VEADDGSNGGTHREEENMNESKYFLRLTERCHRLALECTDPHTASHLATLGDEFLNKAAQLSSKPAAEYGPYRVPNGPMTEAPWSPQA
jgi:hypothetical protein